MLLSLLLSALNIRGRDMIRSIIGLFHLNVIFHLSCHKKGPPEEEKYPPEMTHGSQIYPDSPKVLRGCITPLNVKGKPLKTLQELQMLSSVTLNCQLTKIV